MEVSWHAKLRPSKLASCVLCVAGKARVVNGARATVCDIIYGEGQGPRNMPISILVRFTKVSEPKDNDEVAHQQLPSNFVISVEEKMAQPRLRQVEAQKSCDLKPPTSEISWGEKLRSLT